MEVRTAPESDRRDDVDPKRGKREQGNVEFADPVNNTYPGDTPEHVRAAWSYINHKDNAAEYDGPHAPRSDCNANERMRSIEPFESSVGWSGPVIASGDQGDCAAPGLGQEPTAVCSVMRQ